MKVLGFLEGSLEGSGLRLGLEVDKDFEVRVRVTALLTTAEADGRV